MGVAVEVGRNVAVGMIVLVGVMEGVTVILGKIGNRLQEANRPPPDNSASFKKSPLDIFNMSWWLM